MFFLLPYQIPQIIDLQCDPKGSCSPLKPWLQRRAEIVSSLKLVTMILGVGSSKVSFIEFLVCALSISFQFAICWLMIFFFWVSMAVL